MQPAQFDEASIQALALTRQTMQKAGMNNILPDKLLLMCLLIPYERTNKAVMTLHRLRAMAPIYIFHQDGVRQPRQLDSYGDGKPSSLFSDEMKRLLNLAAQEACLLNSPVVRPEHILWGIASLGTGTAWEMLDKLGVTPELIHREIEML